MSGEAIRVDFHIHSSLSDGTLSPEELAEHLAAAGVAHAALSDHDCVEGTPRFREAAERRGMGCIDAVEITAASPRHGEVHVLGYGIDAASPGLVSALAVVRIHHDPGVRGLVDSLKRIGARSDLPRPAPISAAEAVRLIHAAGGLAFLAHPYSPGRTPETLEEVLRELEPAGLDGLEALYGPYADDQKAALLQTAADHGLAVSGGSDFHGQGIPGQSSAGIAMTAAQWKDFRGRLLAARGARPAHPTGPLPARTRLGAFAARVVLPTALALALFVVSTFAVILPRFEGALLERKKEMIRELTASAVSIMAEYDREVQSGRLSLAEAQAGAAARIRDLRYGREGKDYFWITDMRPVMIMHPYRPDLDGTDVSGYADANGVRVFVEFVNAVREKSEGYVEYLWQWKDDSSRIVPKLSYVRRFAPWNWVVGTGIYLEDVRAEISRLAGGLVGLFAGIAVVIALLLAIVVQQSLAIERRRRAAEASLRESHEKYRALAEASTEGMLMVAGGSCVYANAVLLELSGYAPTEVPLLAPADLLGPAEGEEDSLQQLLAALGGKAAEPPRTVECRLSPRSGRQRAVMVSASPFELPGRNGWILLVRDLEPLRRARAASETQGYAALGRAAALGLFRAAWSRRGGLRDANAAARAAFGIPEGADAAALGAVGLFALPVDPSDGEGLYEELAAGGAVRGREVRVGRGDGESVPVRLTLALAEAPDGFGRMVEGLVEDLGPARREERRREELIAELQASSLYLNNQARTLAHPPCACAPDTTVRRAAALMTRASADAVLVADSAGGAYGIVTDRDLRERVVGGGAGPDAPVREIMSAPLVWISDRALLSEAVAAMRERDLGHLALKNGAGVVTGILRARDLVHLHRHSAAHLQEALQAAATPEEVGEHYGDLPALARQLLDSGARPRIAARIISSTSDLAVRRLVEIAAAREPGAVDRFSFLSVGSEGRQEQVPGSDQDNAMILAEEGAEEGCRGVAENVCAWLAQMGVPRCKGGIMASNPRWRVTLERWQQYFRGWIRQPEPAALLDFLIFFDFRCVAGLPGPAERLRGFVAEELAATPSFFVHAARDLLGRKLPPHGPRSDLAEVDVKDAMAPVIAFARLYALRHGIPATNTFARLEALREAGVLKASTADDVADAWTFLVETRIRAGSSPRIDARSLAHADVTRLRHALAQLPFLHRAVAYDFPGASA